LGGKDDLQLWVRLLDAPELSDQVALRLRVQPEFHVIEHDEVCLIRAVDERQHSERDERPLAHHRGGQVITREHVEKEFLSGHRALFIKGALLPVDGDGLFLCPCERNGSGANALHYRHNLPESGDNLLKSVWVFRHQGSECPSEVRAGAIQRSSFRVCIRVALER